MYLSVYPSVFLCHSLYICSFVDPSVNVYVYPTTKYGQMRHQKLCAVLAPSGFQGQNDQKPQHRITFGSGKVEKMHATVARSAFRGKNAQDISVSERFSTLTC